jgi:zona occludens toxin (predicted ATPase)
MIIAFVGTPGSGKSYEAVKKILDNVALGRTVYSNIDGLGESHCIEYQKIYLKISDFNFHKKINYLNNEQMQHFWDFVTPGSLVVIDEAHTLFSNRDWSSEANRGFSIWATHHRHEGSDAILVSHSIEKIDKHVRSCIEWTYLYKKIEFMGAAVRNSYLWYAYFGDDMALKPVKWGRRSYDKFIFNTYRSYFAAGVKELKITTTVNIFRHPIFFILPVVLVFALYMIFFKSSIGTGNIFGVETDNKKFVENALKKSGKNDSKKVQPVIYERHEPLDTYDYKSQNPINPILAKSSIENIEQCRVSVSVDYGDYIDQVIQCGEEKQNKRIQKVVVH